MLWHIHEEYCTFDHPLYLWRWERLTYNVISTFMFVAFNTKWYFALLKRVNLLYNFNTKQNFLLKGISTELFTVGLWISNVGKFTRKGLPVYVHVHMHCTYIWSHLFVKFDLANLSCNDNLMGRQFLEFHLNHVHRETSMINIYIMHLDKTWPSYISFHLHLSFRWYKMGT